MATVDVTATYAKGNPEYQALRDAKSTKTGLCMGRISSIRYVAIEWIIIVRVS